MFVVLKQLLIFDNLYSSAQVSEAQSLSVFHHLSIYNNLISAFGPKLDFQSDCVGGVLSNLARTSLAALCPACTAPFIYPRHSVAVSVPAK